jgi:hypothetical protein
MPVTKEQADGAIHAFYNEFPGLSGLKIIHRPTQEHFYGAKGSVEALGFAIKGAFLPRQGHIHLALANFHNEGDLRKSLQHEALGHFGTLTYTSSEKRDLLEVIIAARQSPSMKGDWAKVDKAYAGQSELMKAEEVFCLAAERIDGPPSKTADQAARTWSDVVQNKTRPLEREDLQTIAESVADGIRRGTREQQIFPIDDRSQFRKTAELADSLTEATAEAKVQLGQNAKTFPAQLAEGIYKGPIIAETEHHVLQQVSATNTVAHAKTAFAQAPTVDKTTALAVAYNDGAAVVKPARANTLTQTKACDLGR